VKKWVKNLPNWAKKSPAPAVAKLQGINAVVKTTDWFSSYYLVEIREVEPEDSGMHACPYCWIIPGLVYSSWKKSARKNLFLLNTSHFSR